MAAREFEYLDCLDAGTRYLRTSAHICTEEDIFITRTARVLKEGTFRIEVLQFFVDIVTLTLKLSIIVCY